MTPVLSSVINHMSQNDSLNDVVENKEAHTVVLHFISLKISDNA